MSPAPGERNDQPSSATTIVAAGSAISGGTGRAEAATVSVASDITKRTTSENLIIFAPHLGPAGQLLLRWDRF